MRGDPSNPADSFAFAARALDWARGDFLRGEHSRVGPGLQQATEKLLKGWLISKVWNLIKTHDLAALTKEAAKRGTAVEWFLPTAAALTVEYFADRYPGDFDPPPTADETETFLADVERLFSQLLPRPAS